MVIKLMKRELRDSARSFIPVIACILLGSILIPVQLNNFSSSFLSAVINLVLVVVMFSIFILTVRASIYVLYTNLYNQSGYELFTLPIKLWQIIVSKILTLLLWYIAITLVSYIGIILMFVILSGDITMVFEGIGDFIYAITHYGIEMEVLTMLLYMFIGSLQSAVLIFLGGSIANSSYFTKRRGWWTLLFVILISWGLSQFSSLVGMNLFNFFDGFIIDNSSLNVTMDVGRVLIASLYELLITGFLFMGTLWMWDNKLEIMN